MKTWLFAAGALLLATSAYVPTALADQRIPAQQIYAPSDSAQPYAPGSAYAPAPQRAPVPGTLPESTTPAKIGSPKQP